MNEATQYGLGISSIVLVSLGILKLFLGRIKNSSCFGVKIEMNEVKNQVENLEKIIVDLQAQNNTLFNQINNNKNSAGVIET